MIRGRSVTQVSSNSADEVSAIQGLQLDKTVMAQLVINLNRAFVRYY